MKILILAILMVTVCCVGRTQEGTTECSVFEFKNLGKDSNRWKEESAFKKVSDSFFRENIGSVKEFAHGKPNSFYHVCELSSGNLDGYVIAKFNGPILNMYFIPRSGGIAFILACYEGSPDESLVKKSKLVGSNSLEMTTVRVISEEGFLIKDSVVSYYSIEKRNVFEKIKSDSVRSATNAKR
jgi:hypothetical protein